MRIIDSSLNSTWEKIKSFEPLTLGILKLASDSEGYGDAIKMGTYLTVPIDHIIKILSLPIIETADHIMDIIAEKSAGIKALKIIATPIWLPIKAALKTAIFVLHLLTVGLKLPFGRWKKIFRYDNPKSSYLQSYERLQKAFKISSTSIENSIENNWKDKFVRPGQPQEKFLSPIILAFHQHCPDSPIQHVFAAAFTQEPKKINWVNASRSPGLFTVDGIYPKNHPDEFYDENVLALYITDINKCNADSEVEKLNCKSYKMSTEEYKKLPYEISEDLLKLLKSESKL